jgi:Na+/proline symporter
VQSVLDKLSMYVGGAALWPVIWLAWSALLGTFYAILVVVTYHDLRVAKEGVNTDQIAPSSTEIAVLQIDQAEERADEPRVCSL